MWRVERTLWGFVEQKTVGLKRALGPVLLTLYGVGVTVGAGIYVLVGEVAGTAGMGAPVAFLIAGVLAGLSALSYAELSIRFPQAGGEAAFVSAAFARRWLTLFIGLLVVFTGVTSSAAVLLGFVGYLNALVEVSDGLVVTGAVAVLAVITFWGVRESLLIVAAITVVEIGGLLLVIGSGLPLLGDLPAALPEMLPGLDGIVWLGLFSASVLAFFAFIGFEDIVNMAEEVREPHKTMPRAILFTLTISTILYVALAIVSVLSVEPGRLAGSGAPLAMVFEANGGNPDVLSAIAIPAVLNGALVQIIMASRLLYGMAELGRLPKVLAHINPVTRTPDVAVGVVSLVVLASALVLPIAELATYASLAVLLVFSTVNAALLVLRRTASYKASGAGFRVPAVVPIIGATASLSLFGFGLASAFGLIAY